MSESILDTTKKVLNLADNYDVFDPDVMMHINSAFSTLAQLGVGPAQGFAISDASATWDDFLGGDPKFNNVKTYIFLRVKLVFDPPSTSFGITAVEQQIKELEWRLNAQREDESWTPPVTTL